MSLNNLTPSQAYNEYLLNLKEDFDDDLNFHLQKEDRSKCSRRRNFNSLYVKYCQEHFEGKNGPEMFCNLEERIKNCLDTHKDVKIAYQWRSCFNFNDYNPAVDESASKGICSCRQMPVFLSFSLLFLYHCSS